MTYSTDVLALNPDLRPTTVYRTKAERVLKRSDGYDSPLERDFHEELKARGLNVIRFDKHSSGWTFLMPGGVAYTPDFLTYDNPKVMGSTYHITTVYEVKGEHVKNTRESRAKFKIAAGLYPFLRFVWVTRTPAGAWVEKECRP